MKDIELPPLPDLGSQWTPYWTKVVHKQMQSYARAAVEADRAQRVPEIYYEALIHAGWKNHKYAQGTRGCVAFQHGAEWFRTVLLASTPAPAQQEPIEGCDQHWSYYFKVMGCKAKTAQDGDCICWHTEGTGPFDMVRHDDADQFLEWRESPSSAPAPAQQEPATPMDAHRAAYFMRRFLHEEKMLGPNEQAALHFTIAALEAMESAAQHQEPPQQERGPMTREQVRCLMETVGYEAATPQEKADFINGIRQAERHHGIKE